MLFFLVVFENKKSKEVNLSDKFQRHILNNYKASIFIFLK